MKELRGVYVEDISIRGSGARRVRMRGVELLDVDIYGELQHVVVNGVVNGVDIAPLVEAELNRRMPERALMRPDDPDGYRVAWTILERRWGRHGRAGPDVPGNRIARKRRRRVVVPPDPAAPQLCQRIVLNEEWEHRLYAERDLTVLEKER